MWVELMSKSLSKMNIDRGILIKSKGMFKVKLRRKENFISFILPRRHYHHHHHHR